MVKWTEEQINNILGWKDDGDSQINVFDMTVVVCIGTCLDEPQYVRFPRKMMLSRTTGQRMWDVGRFKKWMIHNISLNLKDFEDCNTEEEVRDTANEVVVGRRRKEL